MGPTLTNIGRREEVLHQIHPSAAASRVMMIGFVGSWLGWRVGVGPPEKHTPGPPCTTVTRQWPRLPGQATCCRHLDSIWHVGSGDPVVLSLSGSEAVRPMLHGDVAEEPMAAWGTVRTHWRC